MAISVTEERITQGAHLSEYPSFDRDPRESEGFSIRSSPMSLRQMITRLRERPLPPVLGLLIVFLVCAHASHFHRSDIPAWGWDESMHLELPAARLVYEDGFEARLEAIYDCDQYPFVAPAWHAVWQGLFGVNETVARRTAFFTWIVLGLGGLWLLARRLAVSMGLGEELAPLAVTLAFLSPLVWRFAPSLFLEVPFVVASIWTLLAWMRRQDGQEGWTRRREALAGTMIAIAFFTKFNYAMLLGAALAVDWIFETISAIRRKCLRPQLNRTVWLVIPVLVAFLWWFVYPVPGGLSRGQAHWDVFVAFLSGNKDGNEMSVAMRSLHWGLGAFSHPFWLGFIVLALLSALGLRTVDKRGGLHPGMRVLWLAAIAWIVPVWIHPFFLDRFLIPGLLPVWLLAAVGLSPLFARPAIGLALGAAIFAATLTTPRHAMGDWLGLVPEGARDYVIEVLDEEMSTFGTVPTVGLDREGADKLALLLSGAIEPDERVAWIGMSSEYSRLALHLDLLHSGGSRERFLRDVTQTMDATPVPGAAIPEGFDLAAFASGFDVLVMTSPPDLIDRGGRKWITTEQHAPLVQLGWKPEEIGRVHVHRSNQEPLEVIVFLARR